MATPEQIRDAKVAAFDKIAAMLGSNERWNEPSEYLGSVANVMDTHLETVGLPPVSDQQGTDGLSYWRDVADRLGVWYDDDDS